MGVWCRIFFGEFLFVCFSWLVGLFVLFFCLISDNWREGTKSLVVYPKLVKKSSEGKKCYHSFVTAVSTLILSVTDPPDDND